MKKMANTPSAREIAETMLAGFDKHYRLFREKSAQAKALFERRDWKGIQDLVAYRIQMYDRRVSEAADILTERLEGGSSDQLWAEAKKEYIALLVDHKQPELAETFFNSVSTKVLAKEYFNNRFIFVKPAASTEFIDSDPPVFCTFYPADAGLRGCLQRILRHFGWQVPFAHAAADVADILRAARRHFGKEWPPRELNLHVQVLNSAFTATNRPISLVRLSTAAAGIPLHWRWYTTPKAV